MDTWHSLSAGALSIVQCIIHLTVWSTINVIGRGFHLSTAQRLFDMTVCCLLSCTAYLIFSMLT